MNNPENNKKANTVCWLDVVIFEDNTFAVEIYYVDIVKEFREQFNKHTFTTIEELDVKLILPILLVRLLLPQLHVYFLTSSYLFLFLVRYN